MERPQRYRKRYFFTALCIAVPLLFLRYYHLSMIYDEVVTLKVTYSQRSCSEESDNLLVLEAENKTYDFLVGQDLDPKISLRDRSIMDEIETLRSHQVKQFSITGRLGKDQDAGCNDDISSFWVTEIREAGEVIRAF